MANIIWYLIAAVQITCLVKCDFLIDQRLKEELRQRPPPSPFLNTLYDKSFYYGGPQRPVYNVIKLYFIFWSFRKIFLIFKLG